MQRLADGNVTIIGHGSQKVKFSDSKENEKKQESYIVIKGNGFVSCNNGAQELRYTYIVNETSNKEKFLRKKYIGVWMWESSKVSMMMIMFPVMLSM
jgi:hypothetical protein